MPVGPAWVVGGVVLGCLLAAACVSDLRSRLVPNRIVVATIAAGLVFAVVTKRDIAGLTHAGAGLLTGFGVWFPFYLLRMMGAGDVKLFAASATFLGARGALEGALYAALFGGVLALVFMVLSSGWGLTFIRVGFAAQNPAMLRTETGVSGRRMPYALAMAVGVLVAFWWPGHLIS